MMYWKLSLRNARRSFTTYLFIYCDNDNSARRYGIIKLHRSCGKLC